MTSRKHNSIIFLTTLGVYLGLVLVGAPTPQVFAHGALTRNFELTDEIEARDDLDKNPDGEVGLNLSIKTYLEDVEYFIGALQKLGYDGKFDSSHDAFQVTQSTLLPCVPANNVGSYTANSFELKNESLRPSLERFSKLLTDGYSLADCIPSTRFKGEEAASSKFTVKYDDLGLTVQVSVQKSSPEIAKQVSGDLTSAFATFAPKPEQINRLKIFESTTFRSSNDQVFVVTRLPRAALEPPLAKDAK